MKKLVFIVLGVIVGVGLYYAYKMAKDQGWLGSCCGGTADPWTQYTPPADTESADTTPADTPAS